MIDIPRDDGIEKRCLSRRYIAQIGLLYPMFVPCAIVVSGGALHDNPLWSPS